MGCADLRSDRAHAFADAHDIPEEGIDDDAVAMVRRTSPDIVSVCVPPAAHAEVVMSIARTGIPSAIHCEKPMAYTWGDARAMARICAEEAVTLTFNHQRRFGEPYRRAKSLLDEGAIGSLRRVEFAASNLYDYRTHSIDLCQYFNDEGTPSWVLAGLDYRVENRWFGAHNENQAIVHWQYEDGVDGVGVTGEVGQSAVGAHNRLLGTDGEIAIGVHSGPSLQLTRDGETEAIDTDGEDQHGPGYVSQAIEDVVSALSESRDSELHATNALRSTELIFSAYESVRRRGRVDFPLRRWDNPLVSMVESGELDPAVAD